MREVFLFMLICLKMCLCWHFVQEDNQFNYNVNITQNSWMVMITKNGNEIVSYGVLIHPRAVVTTEGIIRHNIYNLVVFADCHSPSSQEEIDFRICKKFRNIVEYNILKTYEDPINIVEFTVLILEKPFQLTATLNVVHFGTESSVKVNNCIISYPTMVTNPITNKTATLFYPSFNATWPEFSANLLSSFNYAKLQGSILVLAGSPLLCKSKTKTDEWYAVAIIPEAFTTEEFIQSSLIPLNFENQEPNIFSEILKNSRISGSESEEVVYYD